MKIRSNFPAWMISITLTVFGLTGLGLNCTAEEISKRQLILVVGADGEDTFGESFAEAEGLLSKTGEAAGMKVTRIKSRTAGKEPRELVQEALVDLVKSQPTEAWLILLGHGTFDGRTSKFNLEGPDVSAEELAEWLAPFKNSLVVVNCAPSSAPFVKNLSKPNRVIVTATRSGQEKNATRFGVHFAKALTDPRSDRDKDGRISLLEGFLAASAGVEEEYKAAGELATEHAMIDDNGDGTGTLASKFKGIRPSSQSEETLDSVHAHQIFFVPGAGAENVPPEVRKQKEFLEARVETLRKRKNSFANETEYLQALEEVLVPLARISRDGASTPPPAVKPSPVP